MEKFPWKSQFPSREFCFTFNLSHLVRIRIAYCLVPNSVPHNLTCSKWYFNWIYDFDIQMKRSKLKNRECWMNLQIMFTRWCWLWKGEDNVSNQPYDSYLLFYRRIVFVFVVDFSNIERNLLKLACVLFFLWTNLIISNNPKFWSNCLQY